MATVTLEILRSRLLDRLEQGVDDTMGYDRWAESEAASDAVSG